MAKTTAPVEETAVEETAPATAKVFELTPEYKQTIVRSGGRTATPSKYLEEVRAAIGTGKEYGVPIEEGVKATTVLSELRRAGKQLDVKLRLWDRSDASKRGEGMPPFVAFKVIDHHEEAAHTEASEGHAA